MIPLITLFMSVLTNTLTVKSPAFSQNDFIPSKYSCVGDNVNPAIEIGNIPENTKTLALIMDDPDAPGGTFDHWVMWNIPAAPGTIRENSSPGRQGLNGKKENRYMGPCPPGGTHHYHIRVFALDTKLNLSDNTDKETLLRAMTNHILTQGELVGVFKK